MRAGICFHFFARFLSHTHSVTQAYERGLRIRHPRGIRGLGKALNFIALQFHMFLFRILGRIAAQSQKDSNSYNYLLYCSMSFGWHFWGLGHMPTNEIVKRANLLSLSRVLFVHVLIVRSPDRPGAWGCPGAKKSNTLLSWVRLSLWIRDGKATFGLGHTQGIRWHTPQVYAQGYTCHTHTWKNVLILKALLFQDFCFFLHSRHTRGIRRLVIR